MSTQIENPLDLDNPSVLEEAGRSLARMAGRKRQSSPSLDESIESLLEAARAARRSSQEDEEPCRFASPLGQLEDGISSLRELLGRE